MGEVGCPVERIDIPLVVAAVLAAGTLFSHEVMIGPECGDAFGDEPFGGAVSLGDQVGVALVLDGDLAEVGHEEGARRERGSDYKWYVDPLDGTTNFAHGFPVFCVSLGLTHKGQRIAGVIFDPTRNELFAAERGSGAFLNGGAIHVSKTKKLVESLVATGFPSHKRHKNPNIHYYHQITLRSHGVRRAGSAALDLCSVASGRVDAFWEFKLNPWDTAAGVLLVEEAGGVVTDMHGGPFNLDSREVLASNKLIHAELLREFAEIEAGRVEGLPGAKMSS